jgi:ABC-type branched-subunit amino acid transport system ATPase component
MRGSRRSSVALADLGHDDEFRAGLLHPLRNPSFSEEPTDRHTRQTEIIEDAREDRELVKHLSGGEQRLLSVARALLTHPRLLIFDEPAVGLSPLVVRAVRERILRLKQSGILLSEQNVRFAIEVSDRAYVIDKGVIRHQGSVEELRANEEIRKRYLMV